MMNRHCLAAALSPTLLLRAFGDAWQVEHAKSNGSIHHEPSPAGPDAKKCCLHPLWLVCCIIKASDCVWTATSHPVYVFEKKITCRLQGKNHHLIVAITLVTG